MKLLTTSAIWYLCSSLCTPTHGRTVCNPSLFISLFSLYLHNNPIFISTSLVSNIYLLYLSSLSQTSCLLTHSWWINSTCIQITEKSPQTLFQTPPLPLKFPTVNTASSICWCTTANATHAAEWVPPQLKAELALNTQWKHDELTRYHAPVSMAGFTSASRWARRSESQGWGGRLPLASQENTAWRTGNTCSRSVTLRTHHSRGEREQNPSEASLS